MQLKLAMSCHLLNAYTKFQIDISKHVEEKSGKRGRTDGLTDGHCHGIIRPFFKQAYKKGFMRRAAVWDCVAMKYNHLLKSYKAANSTDLIPPSFITLIVVHMDG